MVLGDEKPLAPSHLEQDQVARGHIFTGRELQVAVFVHATVDVVP